MAKIYDRQSPVALDRGKKWQKNRSHGSRGVLIRGSRRLHEHLFSQGRIFLESHDLIDTLTRIRSYIPCQKFTRLVVGIRLEIANGLAAVCNTSFWNQVTRWPPKLG